MDAEAVTRRGHGVERQGPVDEPESPVGPSAEGLEVEGEEGEAPAEGEATDDAADEGESKED